MPLLDPLDLLTLADELAGSGGEVRLRAAVGRAYYALFLLAREKTSAYPSRKEENSHALVFRALRKRGKWTAANLLYDLKELRIVADYQLEPVRVAERDWNRNWGRARSLAKRILRELQSI